MSKNDDGTTVIRPACAVDIPQMCALLSDLFGIEADFTSDTGKQADGLKLLLEDRSGKAHLVVAVHAGAVVGMCSAQTVISTAEGGPSGLVEDLVVRRDLLGKGIGTALLGHVLTWCKDQQIARVQLLADKENAPALAFYTGRGWDNTRLICLRKRL